MFNNIMRLVVLFLSLSILFSIAFNNSIIETKTPQENNQSIINSQKPSGDYQSKLKSIELDRQKLAQELQQSTNKTAILAKASKLLVSTIDQEIFPYWYGTDWDFNGTTQIPKEGQIACGYFVTTVLRDVGIKLNRVTLAQQASENIIKSLTSETYIKRFRNVAIEKFVEDIKKIGQGLFLVGLDNHVGFILNDGTEIYFIHSSYVEPSEVIKEKALTSPILSSSKYRVIGKISADENLLVKWLNQTSFPTVKH